MPTKGGKKKGKRNTGQTIEKRTLIYKDNMEEYSQVSKMLGDRRIMVMLPDKSELLAIIPRRFRKRCWIKLGDVLLISRREYQQSKLDVIYKYTDMEARKLAKEYEIPEFFLDSLVSEHIENNDNFLWEEDDDDENNEDDDEDKQKNITEKFSYEDINNMISDEESED